MALQDLARLDKMEAIQIAMNVLKSHVNPVILTALQVEYDAEAADKAVQSAEAEFASRWRDPAARTAEAFAAYQQFMDDAILPPWTMALTNLAKANEFLANFPLEMTPSGDELKVDSAAEQIAGLALA